MIDTVPMPFDPLARQAPRSRPFDAAAPLPHSLTVVFGGSGSEYFRIWIVNLLLTLVTLGLYYPWAKVRRLRYFYANTRIGDYPLDFHGDPKRMLRGFVLVAAMVGLYSLAGQVSPLAGLIAFVLVAAVWPALFRASQQFRMANTSWRGLRFRFDGATAGAYRAMLPLFVPGVLVLLAGIPGGSRTVAGLVGFAMLAALALFPLCLWMLKKYQHDHYALGGATTELATGPAAFYGLGLKIAGVAIAAALLIGAAGAVVGGLASLTAIFRRDGPPSAATVFAVVLLVFALYGAVVLAVLPFATARLQNLVWNATRSRLVRFESTLGYRALLGLTLKNWLLVLATLGLYLPFAKIATARLRLEAVTVRTLLDPDELTSTLRVRADDATGDAAGDLFGIDVGL